MLLDHYSDQKVLLSALQLAQMEQGNEGDEIILLALRQIECEKIDDSVTSIAQLGPEAIVEIVARSLWLISQGESQFPFTLPKSIAQKHRICTNMATKVKELGFTGDCGYNQLLYPVEAHTRPLLNWLVQKLPRSDDTGAEDAVAGNELMHRRMMSSIASWKQTPWVLPFCTNAAVTKNLYSLKSARVAASRATRSHGSLEFALPMFNFCNESTCPDTAPSKSISTSVFERHSIQLQKDIDFALRLEEGEEDSLGQESTSTFLSSKTSKQIVANAFSGIKKISSLAGAGTLGNAQVGLNTSSLVSLAEHKEAEMMGKSLNDIIAEISSGADQNNDNNADCSNEASGRGTRFTHSTAFAQENTSAKGIGSLASSNIVIESRSNSSNESSSQSNVASSTEDKSSPELSSREKAALATQAKIEARRKAAEEEERKLTEELESLREQVRRAEAKVDDMERSQQNAASKSRNLENEVTALQQGCEELEKEIILKRKTLEMLPSASDNIGKLQTICANSAKRLMTLAHEWEGHRLPLIEKYRDLKSSKTRRREKCKGMVDDMKRCREEMVAMVQDLREKQEKSTQLVEEVKKLPRNINRTLYTHRIMDIIASISKQNKDISKITEDIRNVQKTINQSSNTLQRADAVCEDTIYKAANGPNCTQPMIDSYRNLVKIRANFDTLVETVNKIGQLENQTSELETKVDQELSRVSSNNFDRIRSDLDEVREDNNRLISQIKALRK